MHSTKNSSTLPSPTGVSGQNAAIFKVRCSISKMDVLLEMPQWDQKLKELSKQDSSLSVEEAGEFLTNDDELMRECTDDKAKVIAKYRQEVRARLMRMHKVSLKERNSRRKSSMPAGKSNEA